MSQRLVGSIASIFANILVCAAAPTPAAAKEVRLALVVGTSDYPTPHNLMTPVRDATDVARALAIDGFELPSGLVEANGTSAASGRVVPLINLKRSSIIRAVYKLKEQAAAEQAKGNDVTVLFYFAGHGAEFGGSNYLIPAGTSLFDSGDFPDESAYEAETINARSDVLDVLVQSGANRVLLVLDACRTNPFAPPGSRGGVTFGGRLRAMGAESYGHETMIFYSAGPKYPAYDTGKGDNSPFAGALVGALAEPGLPLTQVTADVYDKVVEDTAGKQQPFVEGNPFKFLFRPIAVKHTSHLK